MTIGVGAMATEGPTASVACDFSHRLSHLRVLILSRPIDAYASLADSSHDNDNNNDDGEIDMFHDVGERCS